MTKSSRRIRLGAAALAVSLAALSAPAAAQDGVRERVIAALADAIAAQGNAALVQIRSEIKEQLVATLEPYLPPREDVTAAAEIPADAATPR